MPWVMHYISRRMWQGPVGVIAVPEATFEALVCAHRNIAAHTIMKFKDHYMALVHAVSAITCFVFWDHAASVAQMLWSVATRDSFSYSLTDLQRLQLASAGCPC